jgi:hypothetical protein
MAPVTAVCPGSGTVEGAERPIRAMIREDLPLSAERWLEPID